MGPQGLDDVLVLIERVRLNSFAREVPSAKSVFVQGQARHRRRHLYWPMDVALVDVAAVVLVDVRRRPAAAVVDVPVVALLSRGKRHQPWDGQLPPLELLLLLHIHLVQLLDQRTVSQPQREVTANGQPEWVRMAVEAGPRVWRQVNARRRQSHLRVEEKSDNVDNMDRKVAVECA